MGNTEKKNHMFTSRIVIISALLLVSPAMNAQYLKVSFTPSGASSVVDSVQATNLRTNTSVSFPGNDTLILEGNTGFPELPGSGKNGSVFPNPCNGRATLVVPSGSSQTALIRLINLSGQVLTCLSAEIRAGENIFNITVSHAGVYLLSVETSLGVSGYKIICTESRECVDRLSFAGIAKEFTGSTRLKNRTDYRLAYNRGDILLYRCQGGIHTTIITDSPEVSKSYTVEFVPCTDPAGKSYAVVKIGSQTWMAENLAWLPKVMKPDTGAENQKFYYVYDFLDTSVAAARTSPNYIACGVLYNWPAAMNETTLWKNSLNPLPQAVCPQGWHLPSDEEWKALEMNLGMTPPDADTLYMRSSGEVGMKLKSTTAWPEDTLTTNQSGLTSLPGGYRNTHGLFDGRSKYCLFWTSTASDTMSWYRCINFNDRGVYRMTTLRSHGLSVRCVKD